MKARLPFWLILLLIAAVIVIGLWGDWSPELRWLSIVGIITGFLILLGGRLNHRWDGILIDSRYKISLARFQIFLWTMLTFSAFFTIALERNHILTRQENSTTEKNKVFSTFDPLNIAFPKELLLALGISATSLAGASIIKNVKKGRETGRSLDLLIADRERVAKKKEEAQKTMDEATDQAKELSAEETDLRKTLDANQTKVIQLEGEVEQKQSAVKQALEALDQDKEDKTLKKILATTEGELDEKVLQLEKARRTLDNFKKRFDAGIAAIAVKANQAGKSKEMAQIIYDRATEELKRMDEALRKKEGLIHKNDSPAEADWIDMFRGDEVGNYQIIDISKVQMFFFTIAIVFTYGVLLWISLGSQALESAQFNFPPFSDSMNALLGLSHAGYLVVKGTG
jgi:hypothetical protein